MAKATNQAACRRREVQLALTHTLTLTLALTLTLTLTLTKADEACRRRLATVLTELARVAPQEGWSQGTGPSLQWVHSPL